MPTGYEQVELNYVAAQNFYMLLEHLPTVQYNLQQVTIPTITGGEADLANRFNPGKTFIPGNSLDYGTLDCTFIIDKQFNTYRELLKWLKAINHPDTQEVYTDWVKEPGEQKAKLKNFERTMTTINLFATDAAARPVAEWVFYNSFPISVDGPQYDAGSQDVEYLQSTASFRFSHFEHYVYSDKGRRLREGI